MSEEWGYSIEEYQLYIGEFSNVKHLIVEGKTDEYLFNVLLDEFFNSSQQKITRDKMINRDEIEIDEITTFIKNDNLLESFISGAVGNRTKIEYIHKNVHDLPKYNNLVFFVDREFDNFVISLKEGIKDEINTHKIEGSLIWSRGHSIENYLFDFTVLYQPLRNLSNLKLFKDAIKIFENNFYSTILLASAVSITLKECGKIQALEKMIDWELIDIDISNVNLRIADWKKRMHERGQKDERGKTIRKFSTEEIDEVINSYQNWYKKLKDDNVDVNLLRWICHGHIGIQVILEVYLSCVNYCALDRAIKSKLNQEINTKEIYKEANQKIHKSGKDNIWEEFVNWWAHKAVRNECHYPLEVLEKLGVI